MNGKTEKQKIPEFVVRTCSVPVVCRNPEDYKRITKTVRTFQRVVSQLAAENFVLTLATSTIKQSKSKKYTNLVPDKNTKKELCSLVYGGNPGKTNSYELRGRFFGLWNEALEADNNLPELGSWIWDAMIPKFCAADENEKMKKLNELRIPRFSNFGLSILHCDSRKYASCFHVSDEDISFKFKVNNDPDDDLILIAAGNFVINNDQGFKALNMGHSSILHRISEGRMSWSNPTVRIDRKNRLWVDFSYKTQPRQLSKTGKSLVVLLRPFHDIENDEKYLCQLRYMKDGKVPENHGKFWYRGVRCEHALEYLMELKEQNDKLGIVNEAVYSNRDRTAKKTIVERMAIMEIARKKFVKDQNHNFSREIVFQADRMGCDKIILTTAKDDDIEKDGETEAKISIFGTSWRFFELKQFIKYKAQIKGIQCEEGAFPQDVFDTLQFL